MALTFPGLTASRALIAVGISSAAFGLTTLTGPWLPRFTFDPLNYGFTGLAALAVPLSLGALGFAAAGFWRKTAALVLAAVVSVPLVPYGFLAILEAGNAKDGHHLSHQKLSEITARPGTYRLYLTNCGASCAYGLELMREVDLLGLAKLVSPVWSANGEEAAELRLSSSGEVQVVRGEYVLHTVGQNR